jgi:hemolysin D
MNARTTDLGDLLGRYATIWWAAWEQRHNVGPNRLSHELAFLPAHLELTESPPHPAPLWTARLLISVILAATLLATFGHLDIVAVAPGQLIPNANVKVVQPAVTAVVRRIYVQNGARVAAGQLLMDLDPTQTRADVDKAKARKIDAELATARARALLVAQRTGSDPLVPVVRDATMEQQEDAQSLATGAFREYRDKILSMRAELRRREAELGTTQEEVAKLQQTVPLAREQAGDYQELAKGKYVAAHEALDKERIAIEQTHDLAAEESRSRELDASIEAQRRDIEETSAIFTRSQWEILNATQQEVLQDQEEETKADARLTFMRLRSPVAGIVQQLSVHTVGGVVTGAQPLMEIVPDDVLEVEARISNKDIGFVEAGQTAIVKLETFPYTRFGYLTGKVIKVANDATSDRKLGLIFLARIQIPSSTFKADNKSVHLSPGMEVTTEIKTGRRTVWQYFLSPLLETGQESLKER